MTRFVGASRSQPPTRMPRFSPLLSLRLRASPLPPPLLLLDCLCYSPLSFSLLFSCLYLSTNQPDASLQVLGLEDLPRTRHPLYQDGQPGEIFFFLLSIDDGEKRRKASKQKRLRISPLFLDSLRCSSCRSRLAITTPAGGLQDSWAIAATCDRRKRGLKAQDQGA